MMKVEISQLLTIFGAMGSTFFTLWAHGREFKKAQKLALKEYGAAAVDEEGIRRDIRHLQRSMEQMSKNVAHLDDESSDRINELFRGQSRLEGALDVLMSLNRTAWRSDD